MKLYKYVPPERVDILENEKIAFTPPDRFKDPFEMRLRVSRNTKRAYFADAFNHIENEMRRANPKLKPITAKQRKIAKRELASRNKFGEQFEDAFQSAINSQSASRIGVLSLCAVNNENLMWYHYADGHRGFVLEFDSEQQEFRNLGATWPVTYLPKPPIYDLATPAVEFFRFKPKYLEYEAEYRIIRPLDECAPSNAKDGTKLYFRELPRRCVKAVYFGHRMEGRVRDKILQLLGGTATLKIEVVPSRTDYGFSFRELA